MKRIKLFVLISLIAAFLTACGSVGGSGSAKSSIVGRWEAADDGVEVDYGDLTELEFFSDGTYDSNEPNYTGDYSIDGDRIMFTGVIASSYTFTFELSGDSLTLFDDDGNSYEYEKAGDSSGSDYSKDDLVGRWEALDRGVDVGSHLSELEFFSDGSYDSNSSNYSGGYSVDGNRLKLSGILVESMTFTFEIDGDTMTIYEEDGNEEQYERVSD